MGVSVSICVSSANLISSRNPNFFLGVARRYGKRLTRETEASDGAVAIGMAEVDVVVVDSVVVRGPDREDPRAVGGYGARGGARVPGRLHHEHARPYRRQRRDLHRAEECRQSRWRLSWPDR